MAGITNTDNTIADKLTDLVDAKEDMKDAIISKGVTPTGGLSTYAEAIERIITPASYLGIKFNGGVYVSKAERSGVFDSSAFTSMNSLYRGLYDLKIAELIDTSNVTDMSHMFYNCRALEVVPEYNTSKVTNMSYMFSRCYKLPTIPLFDTSKVTNMSHMFYMEHDGFGSQYMPFMLSSVPLFDTSKVTNMSHMFRNCHKLSSVPLFDTSNVTDMSYMFYMNRSYSQNSDYADYIPSLLTIPQFNTSNVTDMSYMFSGCASLTTIPVIDTSKVTNMSYMFSYCKSLTTIPEIDTSNVTDMSNMFEGCVRLTTLPEFDCSNVTNIGSIFYISSATATGSLENIGGFKNLGKQESLNTPLETYSQPNISRQSMLNIVNGLYDRASAGYKSLYIGISNIKKLLTDDEIAIATNKGWKVYG